MDNFKVMMHQNRLSLYLHIPFCRHRCSYCDFNTYTSLGELKESYTQALINEYAVAIELYIPADLQLPGDIDLAIIG